MNFQNDQKVVKPLNKKDFINPGEFKVILYRIFTNFHIKE